MNRAQLLGSCGVWSHRDTEMNRLREVEALARDMAETSASASERRKVAMKLRALFVKIAEERTAEFHAWANGEDLDSKGAL